MRGKRKNTAAGQTAPSKGRQGRKPRKAAPTPALSPVAVEAAPPPVSRAMVSLELELASGAGAAQWLGSNEPSGSASPLASATEGEEDMLLCCFLVPKTMLECKDCHVPLKAPLSLCSLGEHTACSHCGAGECFPCERGEGSSLENWFNRVKVACPYRKYGCASSVDYVDFAAHAAACPCGPCACRACSFEGSPVQLVRHLTGKDGQHAWKDAKKITYGRCFRHIFNWQYWDQAERLLEAKEDGCLFFLSLGHGFPHGFDVLCVRNNADAGPAFTAEVTVVGRSCKLEKEITTVASCSDPVEADMAPGECPVPHPDMRQGDEIHLRIRILKKSMSIGNVVLYNATTD